MRKRSEKLPTVSEALETLDLPKIKPGTVVGHRVGGDPVDESEHFYVCKACGQAVDMRDLGQVFHHEASGHEPLPTQ